MKVVRRTYRRDVSFGLMVIVFAVVFFLAGQLFEKHQPNVNELMDVNLAKGLVSLAVIVMVLIVWEEILFHVHIKPVDDGLLFRNHGTKLKVQAMFYLIIPVIIVFVYLNFNVNTFRFLAWAVVVAGLPVVGKLMSGIKNYNDFLKLTGGAIQYKNNELEGTYQLTEVKQIHLVKDKRDVLHKMKVELSGGNTVTIDLDEMELEDFYESINEYIVEHYAQLLK
ncbi:MAG: heavy metal transporter [Cyclobacteriaceae bacterium]|nr:heavy metal transporter [Cyclobacteriaceae bacterium]